MTNWKPFSLNPAWPEVLMTWGDWELPLVTSGRIFLDNLKNRRKNYFEPEYGLGLDEKLCGNVIEAATAKYLDVFWAGNIGLPGATDVKCYETRSVTYIDASLIMHEWDKDCPCISGLLLLERLPNVILRGWRYGSESKDRCAWREDVKKPAYFWKPHTLRTMASLPRPEELQFRDAS